MAGDDVSKRQAETPDNGSDEVERGNWGNRWEFLLSCVGLSVGLGNVWRFPYLAAANGGGAFLIPYIIMLILVGKPMYYMELAFGQFGGLGPVTIWRCTPIAKGIGVAMLVVTFIVAIYYNVLMCYTIFYIAASFQSTVPWSECNPEWADMDTCFVLSNKSQLAAFNGTNSSRISSSQQYWERYVLDISDGIHELNGVKWDLALCLLLSWVIVCGCLFKGIKTSGKVIYFAATFPYVILLTLLIRGLLLEGSTKGILYFIIPDWSKLTDIKVWKAAAGQMFFSLSVSMGGLIMYSSYNPFKNNVHRDAMVVSILDTVTSFISGLVIFSILGAMAHDMDVPVESVVKEGPGLAFVAYPEALSRLPVPQLWSVLFFFMLFILGLDSEFAMIETISTCVSDEYPQLRRHKTKLCIILCVVCYLLGLPCVTRGGQYVLTMLDEYGSSTSLIFIAICECIAIAWVYGISRLCDDIEYMLGNRPGYYWKATWTITSPIALAFIFTYAVIDYKPLKYGKSYEYPTWANALGWMIFLISILQIPIWGFICVFRQNASTLSEKFKLAKAPTSEWGPSDKSLKDDYLMLIEKKKNKKIGIDNIGAELPVELTGFSKSHNRQSANSMYQPGLTNGDSEKINGTLYPTINLVPTANGMDNPVFQVQDETRTNNGHQNSK
ncbi:Solute carrier 6 [Chamberlinius hualienensis]